MTAQPRHARHHRYSTVHAAAVLTAICLFVAAVFMLIPTSAGPVPSGAPGPVLTVPASPVPVVTPVPGWVRHADHRAHVAHLEHWHAEHVRHLAHLERVT